MTNGPVVASAPVTARADVLPDRLLERSGELAEGDPAVRAGRLAVEIMTWYCPPGTMSQPGRSVTLS